MRVAVVGGGIAGLAAAWELVEGAKQRGIDLSLKLFESEPRLGGNIRTEESDGFRAEWGPNGFLDNVPATIDLSKRIGLGDRLSPSSENARKRFLYRNGELHALPASPVAFLSCGVLSVPGRLRVFAEPFGRKPPGGDESVLSFASRRIGKEAASILVDAMVSGVYAGNAGTLSLKSAFPKMYEMESRHGSLVKAMIAKMREAKRAGRKAGGPGGFGGTLTSFEGGLSILVERLGELLGDRVHVGEAVGAVDRRGGSWEIRTENGGMEADAVVLAIPAWRAAETVRQLDGELSGALAAIPSAPIAVVATGFDRSAVGRPLDGFGFLVPRETGPRILGSLWTSSIFSGRAPDGKVLLRSMIGGALDHGALHLGDDELLDAVLSDLRPLIDLRGAPSWVRIFRHPRGIPQYDIGHGEKLRVCAERTRELPGLHLAGNSYNGIAINACVEEAAAVAKIILDQS